MENKRLMLPVGVQTFEKLRKKNCVYVDKTKFLVQLIDLGSIYFLARPRRFGKSLTVSTLEALFSGKKELFTGLYAEEFLNRPGFEPSPVIRLDMSRVTTDSGFDVLRESIKRQTLMIAEEFGIDIKTHYSISDILDELIVRTAKKYNQKVVVLIDEYDKPYTDFVNDPKMADDVRNVLRNYYVCVKSRDEYIRFTFITGISKFAKFGVFSTLNTPLDISMMPKYAEICGYTEEEILQYFPDYIEDTANYMQISKEKLIEEMRHYYNGFSFDSSAKTRLYNPYSTLSFFEKKEFLNYWINTGRPKLIADYLKNRRLTVEQFRNFPVSMDFAENPGDMDIAPPEGFLFQAGYLTLRPGTTNALSLDYPNIEVLNSMSRLLIQNILAENSTKIQNDLLIALTYKDTDKIIEVFNNLLASIPYDDFEGAAKQSIYYNQHKFSFQEWLYRSTILAFLRGCGIVVFPEMHTNLGRADLVVAHNGNTYVIEIKIASTGENTQKKAKEAMQIIDKNYAKLYPNAVSIGLAIDNEERQITAWNV